MNDAPKDWEPSLHDILQGLILSRVRAEFLADKLEHADPHAADVFRRFSEEIQDVWTRYYPKMPTNKDIYLFLHPPTNDPQSQNIHENGAAS